MDKYWSIKFKKDHVDFQNITNNVKKIFFRMIKNIFWLWSGCAGVLHIIG